MRVFHFSINIEIRDTATVVKMSPQLGLLKTGKKRHKKALYDESSEVKVVNKTPRNDHIFFSNFSS